MKTVLLAFLAMITPLLAADVKVKKVLFVGIDGCRPDAIESSQAKHLKRLIENGTYSDRCDVLGERKSKADTASGPGWATILTGVWADKHEVVDNNIKTHNLKNWPHLFARVREMRPKAACTAFVTWAQIHNPILGMADGVTLVVDGDKKGYKDGDKLTADAAVKHLNESDPDLLLIYFGHPDSAGHGYGFHPRSPKYTNAIEEADEHLGRVLEAIRRRKTYSREDWLVIVTTDHGGKGRGHFPGVNEPEIRTGFLIVSGPSARREKLKQKTFTVDGVPTALAHLGITVKSEWRLDGRVIGLVSEK